LEWFFRLCMEPRRLWRRYVYLNPAYVTLLTLQLLGLRAYDTNGVSPSTELLYG
jgi:N-acetylglucosaminyldiphosphoundecaprenol N-acetyl-beta-D-mannosaminyltransferase